MSIDLRRVARYFGANAARPSPVPALVEAASDAFIAMDADGNVTDWNERAARMFGIPRERAIGRKVADLVVPPRFRGVHADVLARFLATGQSPYLNRRLRLSAQHADGREVPVELMLTATRWAGSYVFGAFIHEVAERERLESLQTIQLAVTKILTSADTLDEAAPQILRAMGENLDVECGGFWRAGVLPNDAMSLSFTWCRGESGVRFYERTRTIPIVPSKGLPGRVLASGHPTWIRDVTKDANFPRFGIAQEEGLHGAFGFPIRSGDQVVAVIEFLAERIKEPDPALLEIVADVGDRIGMFIRRRETELALVRARHDADTASKAKSAFLANMSHEIRTPLAAVIGFSELLRTPGLSSESVHRYTDAICRNGSHLLGLIEDVLDFSKIEAGHLNIDAVAFKPAELLAEVVALFAPQAQAKGVTLTWDSAAPLPPFVTSDATRLKQILVNVIANALKFTDQGGITISVRHDEPLLTVTVTDTGTGIPVEAQKRLFQPFVQGEQQQPTARQGGSGLGLALSRRLARALGGDLRIVRSEPGIGSTFELTIVAGATALPLPASEGAKEGDEDLLRGIKVLLVDDAPDIQELVSSILVKAGATVALAGDGLAAIGMAETEAPDVILLDLQMPHLDGYKAAARIRGQGFSKPIIALSAYAIREARELAVTAGCDDFLSKPVSQETLVRRIARHVHPPGEATVRA